VNALRSPHSSKPPTSTGLQRAEAPLSEHLLAFLQAESARFFAQITVPRPWHYAEMHNPWSRAAAAFDSWGFLDICQSSGLIERIVTLIGPDIVLFDSQWLPDRSERFDNELALESDAHRFPVDPPSGLTVLIGVADAPQGTVRVHYRPSHLGHACERRATASINLEAGAILFLESQVPYCVHVTCDSTVPSVYAVRYFPASSRYCRDPAAPVHRALTQRYPLLNYARMPLWLVHGQDRADNDFVTGFNARVGFWTSADW
jgi:hypothetical protein